MDSSNFVYEVWMRHSIESEYAYYAYVGYCIIRYLLAVSIFRWCRFHPPGRNNCVSFGLWVSNSTSPRVSSEREPASDRSWVILAKHTEESHSKTSSANGNSWSSSHLVVDIALVLKSMPRRAVGYKQMPITHANIPNLENPIALEKVRQRAH